MKIGDKVVLRDWVHKSIEILGLESRIGSTFTLQSKTTAFAAGYSTKSVDYFGNSIIWISAEGWYIPDGCLELVSGGPDTKSVFKPGDICQVSNINDDLSKANLTPWNHIGKSVTLLKQSTAGTAGLSKLSPDTILWLSKDSAWWYPESCLRLVTASAPGVPMQNTTTKTVSKKENNSMNLFRVSFIQTPTVLAQQSGDVDTLLAPTMEVMADNVNAAVAIAAATNAEKILKAQGNGKLRVCAAQQVC